MSETRTEFLNSSIGTPTTDPTMNFSWAVIGAGAAGIASVGRLLEKVRSKSKIHWIDPKFDVGKMGNCYREVPANTLNGDLIEAFKLSESFGWNQSQAVRKHEGKSTMIGLPLTECFQLSTFVEALEDATNHMIPQCTVITGLVTHMQRDIVGKWILRIDTCDAEETIEIDAVIYACGSNSISPHVSSATKWPLDSLVNPLFVSKILLENAELQSQRWVVVGGSHSAMLVIMNLVNSGAKNIVNIYRSDIRFMHTTEQGYVRYPGTGLKGPVGNWVKTNLTTAPVVRIRYNDQQTWDEQLSDEAVRADHVVFAIGFERVKSPTIQYKDRLLSHEDLDRNNKVTGEIFESGSALFGNGIAFPQDHVDGGGRTEPWVGFKRSIEQVDLMIEAVNQQESIVDKGL